MYLLSGKRNRFAVMIDWSEYSGNKNGIYLKNRIEWAVEIIVKLSRKVGAERMYTARVCARVGGAPTRGVGEPPRIDRPRQQKQLTKLSITQYLKTCINNNLLLKNVYVIVIRTLSWIINWNNALKTCENSILLSYILTKWFEKVSIGVGSRGVVYSVDAGFEAIFQAEAHWLRSSRRYSGPMKRPDCTHCGLVLFLFTA